MSSTSRDVCLRVAGLLDGVEWVLEMVGYSTVGEDCLDREVFLFLCRPGEADAVLLCFCGGWNRSLDSPGLDLARVTELADHVLLLLLLLLAFLLLLT